MLLDVRFCPLVSLTSVLIFAASSNAGTPVELWRREAAASGYPVGALADKGGNIVLSGSSSSDFYTAKFAVQDGHVLWSRRYNDPENLSDRPSGMALDSSGNVVVTGSVESMAFGYLAKNIYSVKCGAVDGAILWEHFYNGPEN